MFEHQLKSKIEYSYSVRDYEAKSKHFINSKHRKNQLTNINGLSKEKNNKKLSNVLSTLSSQCIVNNNNISNGAINYYSSNKKKENKNSQRSYKKDPKSSYTINVNNKSKSKSRKTNPKTSLINEKKMLMNSLKLNFKCIRKNTKNNKNKKTSLKTDSNINYNNGKSYSNVNNNYNGINNSHNNSNNTSNNNICGTHRNKLKLIHEDSKTKNQYNELFYTNSNSLVLSNKHEKSKELIFLKTKPNQIRINFLNYMNSNNLNLNPSNSKGKKCLSKKGKNKTRNLKQNANTGIFYNNILNNPFINNSNNLNFYSNNISNYSNFNSNRNKKLPHETDILTSQTKQIFSRRDKPLGYKKKILISTYISDKYFNNILLHNSSGGYDSHKKMKFSRDNSSSNSNYKSKMTNVSNGKNINTNKNLKLSNNVSGIAKKQSQNDSMTYHALSNITSVPNLLSLKIKPSSTKNTSIKLIKPPLGNNPKNFKNFGNKKYINNENINKNYYSRNSTNNNLAEINYQSEKEEFDLDYALKDVQKRVKTLFDRLCNICKDSLSNNNNQMY